MKNYTSIEALEPRIAPATILVTSTANSGAGSLRDAIIAANGTPAADVIVFKLPAPSTIILTTDGDIEITAPLTVKGPGAGKLTISGNNASRIFAVADNVIEKDSPLTVSGITFTGGNESMSIGGAIYSIESLTVKNCVFTNNTAEFGGAIYVNASALNKVTITGSVIVGNSATDFSGGGVHLRAGKGITISKTNISSNTAISGGGGAYLVLAGGADPTAKIVISDSTIRGNSANTVNFANGGGISAELGGHAMLITKSEISGNFVRSFGGGLYVNDGTLTVTASNFHNNTLTISTGDGGGIFLNRTIAKLSAIRVTSNTSGNDGGGIAFDAESDNTKTLTLTSSLIAGNTATGDGGGIAAYSGGSLALKNTTIRANDATRGGGGIAFNSQALTIIGGLIADNTAQLDGGGIAMQTVGKLTLNKTTVSGNSSVAAGGGVFLGVMVNLDLLGGTYENNTGRYGGAVYANGAGNVLIKGAKFLSNRATQFDGNGGGVFLVNNLTTTVTQTLFKGNFATQSGGGIYLGSGVATLTGITALDNVAGGGGGGIFISSNNTLELSKSLFKGNLANSGGGILISSGIVNIATTIITGNIAISGTGGIFKNANSTVAPTVKIFGNIAAVNPDKNF